MKHVNWTKPMAGKQGRLGQPYDAESWTFTVREKFGNGSVVYAYTPPGWITHQQGVNQLLSLGQTYGASYIVCGVYKKAYQYYGPGTSYCTYDGGVTYQVGAMVPPPPEPVATVPIPFYTRQSIFPFVETPFIVPFGRTTTITWTNQARPMPPFHPIFGARRVQWIGRTGRLGQGDLHDTITYKSCYNMCAQKCTAQNQNNPAAFDACVVACDPTCLAQAALEGGSPTNVGALQAKINAALATQKICPIGADGKLGPTTCAAAIYVQTYLDGSVAVPAQCGSIDQSKSAFNPDCKTGTPGPAPGCTDNAGCSPTQDCVNGKCVDKCPANYTRNATGDCVANPAVSSTSTGLGGVGALALAGLALGAFAFFGKPPKLPKSAAGRLQQNPKRRRHKKRGRYAA